MGHETYTYMYIIISVQEIKSKNNQQHPPPPPLACSLEVFWVSVTVLGCFPPLLPPPPCDLGLLSTCDSRNVFASCKKSSSMLFEFLAEVSRKGMSFSCANCRPSSCVISLSVRSLLLPAQEITSITAALKKKKTVTANDWVKTWVWKLHVV